MADSAESVVRNFMDTWPRSDIDEIVAFFSDDAVYTDGPEAPITVRKQSRPKSYRF